MLQSKPLAELIEDINVLANLVGNVNLVYCSRSTNNLADKIVKKGSLLYHQSIYMS